MVHSVHLCNSANVIELTLFESLNVFSTSLPLVVD